MYENKKILILGAAKSGISSAKLLASKNNDLTLSDIKPLDEKQEKELKDLGVKIIITDKQIDLLSSDYDLVVKNPAIMATSDIVKKCHELNLTIVNELEVAYHFLPDDVTIIGITGSNGKTTVTTMIYELLKKLGKSVILGGNIGFPLSQIIYDIKKGDILVLELSDHQLSDFHDFKTNISVLTNISPAHLDYHGSYENYKNAKKKIFNLHTKEDLAIINNNNKDALEVSKDIASKKLYFGNEDNYFDEKGIYLDKEKVLDLDEIMLKGNHNYENILATLLVIKNFGWNQAIISEFFKNFGGVAHRLEYVGTFDGVTYYNDSKSTNTASTITALKTFKEPVHLILGGLERYQDFHDLDKFMSNVVCIYALGQTSERIKEYAESINKKVEVCHTLENAFIKIKENVKVGDVVLLSPASSSQDVYARFEDRGDEFKKLVAK